jgi:hypothetical protein
MSIEAMAWALNYRYCEDATEKLVLLGLANHAAHDGTGARPGQAVLAHYAHCSDRTVRRKLVELERRAVIRRGDQGLTSHIPPQLRPVVWDLSMGIPDILWGGQSDRTKEGGQSVRADTTVSALDGHNGVRSARTRMSDITVREPSDKPSELKDSLAKAEEEPEPFDLFWAQYPRKQDKRDARKFWDRITTGKNAVDPAALIAGAARYAADPNRDPEFTKLPGTWLNKGGWEDEPLPARHGNTRDRQGEILRGELETARRADAADRAALFALPGGRP